jgi:hypothetical protein
LVAVVSTICIGNNELLQIKTPNHTRYEEGDHLKMCLKIDIQQSH